MRRDRKTAHVRLIETQAVAKQGRFAGASFAGNRDGWSQIAAAPATRYLQSVRI
jgi:hypothetical protein